MPLPRPALALAAAVGLAAAPRPAHAVGFHVAGGQGKPASGATMVVLMREGSRTVVSLQRDYRGPNADFAMVVPVPASIQKRDIKTIPRGVFDRIDAASAPRLVELWEQDPCSAKEPRAGARPPPTPTAAPRPGASSVSASDYGVRVEAEVAAGEYDVAVLGAGDAGGLEAWLRDHHYTLPAGAGEALSPYVAAGMKFFVAKVDPRRLAFEGGRALLSPIRFHYDSPDFGLPLRLGLLDADGPHDVVITILARGKRFEASGPPSLVIPTNLDVVDGVRGRFGAFYAALFDRALEKHPGAIVTEHAWDALGCDACPGPALGPPDLVTLGADVISAATPPPNLPTDPSLRPVVTVRDVKAPDDLPDAASRLERELPFFTQCYTDELGKSPSPKGKVEVKLERAEMRPTEVAAVASGTLGPRVAACVEQVARGIHLQRLGPVGETAIAFSVDFDLRRDELGRGWWRPPPPDTSGFVLTRLHTRIAKGAAAADLVFREAPAIAGGHEEPGRVEQEHAAKPGSVNAFQARYAIRHRWAGAFSCASPERGVWGGPPAGAPEPQPLSASRIAYAPRGQVQLESLLAQGVPDFGARTKGSCACTTSGTGGASIPCALGAMAALVLRERRRRRRG